MDFEKKAATNFEQHLIKNPYPGRGLVIGKSDNQNWVIIYWIMGRSPNSRNRRFVAEAGVLRTEPVDISKVKDPSLIIYEAMLELPNIFIVSNGDQTRTIYEGIQKGLSFPETLAEREREPDAPNFTPRISGMLSFVNNKGAIDLSILKANPLDPAFTDRYYYQPSLPQAGYGVGLTTYSGDGDPLPSFFGDPMLLPCQGSAEKILETYWSALDAENRVSLAIKEVPADGQKSRILIKNQF
ncbi:MAG: IMP cyclohydrolase [Thermodesulfobacteriota bacterium]